MVSHCIESIVAVFIRSRTTVCHKAIGRSSQGRTDYSCGEINEANESVGAVNDLLFKLNLPIQMTSSVPDNEAKNPFKQLQLNCSMLFKQVIVNHNKLLML